MNASQLLVAVAGRDTSVTLWDVPTWRAAASMTIDHTDVLVAGSAAGAEAGLLAAQQATTPAPYALALGTDAATLRIWDLRTNCSGRHALVDEHGTPLRATAMATLPGGMPYIVVAGAGRPPRIHDLRKPSAPCFVFQGPREAGKPKSFDARRGVFCESFAGALWSVGRRKWKVEKRGWSTERSGFGRLWSDSPSRLPSLSFQGTLTALSSVSC